MQLLQHKVVSTLPVLLQPNSIYYVRNGTGFDQYITNSNGVIVAYPQNTFTLVQTTGQSTTSAMSQKAVTDTLEEKVNRVTGKDLSDENFTKSEKTKLANVGDPTRDFVSDYLLKREGN